MIVEEHQNLFSKNERMIDSIPLQDKNHITSFNPVSSLKKFTESFSRYIETSQYYYEIPWQSTFLTQINPDLIFIRGKYQMLDVIGTKDLQYLKTIETQGHGVFSAWTDSKNRMNQMAQLAYIGCHDGHMYTVDLSKLELVENQGYVKLRQGIYDIV